MNGGQQIGMEPALVEHHRASTCGGPACDVLHNETGLYDSERSGVERYEVSETLVVGAALPEVVQALNSANGRAIVDLVPFPGTREGAEGYAGIAR